MERYSIEIYAPGEFEDPALITMEASAPPLLPAVGDLINLRSFPHALSVSECPVVRVTAREHLFMPESKDGKPDETRWLWQRIMLYTESVVDDGEARIPGYPDN